jgi:hypothetical protein
MRHRSPRTVLIALALATLLVGGVGCSLAFSASDVDRGCGGGMKWCDGQCVGVDDPAYGCADPFCEPCPLQNAIPGCGDHGCYVQQCVYGFAECPSGGEGCAANILTDETNCGECKLACGSGEVCILGHCSASIPQGVP